MKKVTTTKPVKDTTVRMSYETYAHLKYLIEEDMNKWQTEFQTACGFIPSESYVSGKKTGVDKAHDIFIDVYTKMRRMLKELHEAAGATYKDHPSKEMREFWGLKV